MAIAIGELGAQLAKRRGPKGIRAAAEEIGISPATLNRIEHGHMPDLETFAKVCNWLNVDPADYLGTKKRDAPAAAVHFRKDKTMSPETAQSLAKMILKAQSALLARDDVAR
jgi:transcriptional regulator with XRE-family HTH domain